MNTEAVIKAARDLLESIADMQAMPGEALEHFEDTDPTHWFGGFGTALDVATVYEPMAYIEWPNLAICARDLRAALDARGECEGCGATIAPKLRFCNVCALRGTPA